MNLTSAELYSNTLTGTVPASWSELKHLQLVNLGENYLTGSLFSFPRNLTKYSIRCNKFSGLLPALNWSQLQVFEVGGPNNINPGPTKCEKHYQVNNWTCPLPAIPAMCTASCGTGPGIQCTGCFPGSSGTCKNYRAVYSQICFPFGTSHFVSR